MVHYARTAKLIDMPFWMNTDGTMQPCIT